MSVKLNNNSNDFLKSFISSVEGTSEVNTTSDRKQPTIYINIGFYSEVLKDNEGNSLFVSLPYGLPLDTMADIKVGNGKSTYAQLCELKNKFKQQLLHKLEKVPAGTAVELPFTIQVFKTGNPGDKPDINTSEIDAMMDKIKI